MNTSIESSSKSSSAGKYILIFVLIVVFGFVGWFLWSNPSVIGGGVVIGDEVHVLVDAKFEDGSVFTNDTISFVLWDQTVDSFLENEILGMKAWSKKKFELLPGDWYGKYYDPRQIQQLPVMVFQLMEITPEIGWYYDFGWETGVIVDLDWTWDQQIVTIDGNSPETFNTIFYTIELL